MWKRWPGFVFIGLLLLTWELASRYRWIDPLTMPAISDIFRSWTRAATDDQLFGELMASLVRIAWGFALSVVAAVPIGIAMGSIRLVYLILEPVTELVRPIPSSAYIPVAILFLGIDNEMKIFVIFLASFFPILLNTYSGVKSVDPVLIDTGLTFNVSWLDTVWSIILPAAMPSILTGMRISLGISLVVAVVAEMIAGSSGIGYFILNMQRTFRVPEMFAGIFTLGLLGFSINYAFLRIESHLLRWRGANVEA